MQPKIKCNCCNKTISIHNDRWKKLIAFYGSKKKVLREFECKSCDVLKKTKPIEYSIYKSKELKILTKEIKIHFKEFNKHRNSTILQEALRKSLNKINLTLENNINLDIVSNKLKSYSLKNIPFLECDFIKVEI